MMDQRQVRDEAERPDAIATDAGAHGTRDDGTDGVADARAFGMDGAGIPDATDPALATPRRVAHRERLKERLADAERRLMRTSADYLTPADVANVEAVLRYAHELTGLAAAQASGHAEGGNRGAPTTRQDVEYAIAVAQTLAEGIHIDAVTLAAVLLYQYVEAGMVAAADVRTRLGGSFGDQVASTSASIERFDTLQRPGAQLRRTTLSAQAQAEAEGDEAAARTRRRPRERQRESDSDQLRKMFMAMAEDPRVVVIKIADHLRLMRVARAASDAWRTHEAAVRDGGPEADAHFVAPSLSPEECRLHAEETRELFAPLAGRLGMSRVETELDDLAFAILEPDDYRWLAAAVRAEASGRRSYVDKVISILRQEMAKIGVKAEISGRVKHLYSIYKKVKRSGSRDLSDLYDILAFRIVVESVAECYLALGHVHELWRPKDGRIKDFIASPKPNGYQSLHTTVFCLGERLAEIQIRTHEMHQVAEYGVAMHWYYKDVGDKASAKAEPLQEWVQQVREWQRELQGNKGAQVRTLEAVKGDVLREQIYVFTPAGDARELPAGATPLDFAYRVHSDLGNHVAGVRITSGDGTGRLVKKLVPLDYELKNGDVVEILKGKDAHPTRDWLRVVTTKNARDRITKYLKEREHDIDEQRGRERLDREVKTLGLRRGIEDLDDDDLEWLAGAIDYRSPEAVLVALGNEKLRMSAVLPRLRERLKSKLPVAPEPEQPTLPTTAIPAREEAATASVQGLVGVQTSLAACCNPIPGDELCGFTARMRGVVIHRADCPNLRNLAQKHPERLVAVSWPALDGKQTFRAPILVEAGDRPGLLRDVTGVITGHKINMLSVSVTTRGRPPRAVVNAMLEIKRPEELETVLRDLRGIGGVEFAERREPNAGKGGK